MSGITDSSMTAAFIAHPLPTVSDAGPDPPSEMPRLFPLSVEQYHAMIDAGILTENDNCELIEGLLVEKMGKKPQHSYVTQLLQEILQRMSDGSWFVNAQESVTTLESEPEPDVTAIVGQRLDFRTSHPRPDQVALLVEVSESTLAYDRSVKKRLYARAGIAAYWIVNLVERQIEVHTTPSGPGKSPTYAQCAIFKEADVAPVVIEGREFGKVVAKDLLT